MALLKEVQADGARPIRRWLPLLVLIALGVGALGIGLNFLFVPTAVQADSVAALAGQEYVDVQLAAFDANPLLIRSHAAIGTLFAVVAALQFWPAFRKRDFKRHRLLGFVSGACLILLPVTGVAATIVYPFAGFGAVLPNLVWMAAILFCVIQAWRAIRARDVIDHEAWITRATAMTFGITLSRIYEPILVHAFHMDVRTAFAAIFWLGQGEGLIVAEIWLRRPGGPLARRRAREAARA